MADQAPSIPSVAALGEITQVGASEVYLAADNPRRIPERAVEVVALSLQRFGWQQPIVIDTRNVVVAGHTRLLAARKLGLKDVPVVIASNLTEEEIEAFRIADNRTHDFSSWDMPMLVEQLDALADEFGDVLALEDWESLVNSMSTAEKDALPDLGLPDDVGNTLDAFEVTVCFATKEQAVEAGTTLIEIPGVFDVRHKY